MKPECLSLLAAASFLTSTAFAQGVALTVDDDGPADFVTIQGAINAAADGDRILVRTGTYAGIEIDGKGLSIHGEGDVLVWNPGLVFTEGPSTIIRSLAPDQSVVLRGLTLRNAGVEKNNIEIEDNAGAIVLEEIELQSAGYPIRITNSESVTFVRTVVDAPPTFISTALGFYLGLVSYNAVVATDSNVFAYDSEFRGSLGNDSGQTLFGGLGHPDAPSGPGGNGFALIGGSLFASGSIFEGGDGGLIPDDKCIPGAAAGAGIAASGTLGNEGVVRLLDCTTTAGTAGPGSCGNPPGNQPADLELVNAVLDQLPGLARSVQLDSIAIEGATLDLLAGGVSGDAAFLFFGFELAPGLFLPTDEVVAHLAAPFNAIPIGVVPASGSLQARLPLPTFLSPLDSLGVSGQVLFYDGSGFFVSAPTTTLIAGAGL